MTTSIPLHFSSVLQVQIKHAGKRCNWMPCSCRKTLFRERRRGYRPSGDVPCQHSCWTAQPSYRLFLGRRDAWKLRSKGIRPFHERSASHVMQRRRQTGTAEALAEAAYRSARRPLWKHPAQSGTPLSLIIPCMRTFVKQGRRALLSLIPPGRVFWRGIERGTARSLEMFARVRNPFLQLYMAAATRLLCRAQCVRRKY